MTSQPPTCADNPLVFAHAHHLTKCFMRCVTWLSQEPFARCCTCTHTVASLQENWQGPATPLCMHMISIRDGGTGKEGRRENFCFMQDKTELHGLVSILFYFFHFVTLPKGAAAWLGSLVCGDNNLLGSITSTHRGWRKRCFIRQHIQQASTSIKNSEQLQTKAYISCIDNSLQTKYN